MTPLTPTQLEVLRAVRVADEAEGGLALEGLDEDARDALDHLARRALVEVHDDDDAWGRITGLGVQVLRERHGA